MNASDFLLNIQKNKPKTTNKKFLKSKLFKELSKGINTKEYFLKFKENDYTKNLYDYASTRIPSQLKSLVKDKKIIFAELYDPRPDAKCRIFPDDYLITFNSGLRDFIYRIIRVYSTRYDFSGNKGMLSFEETCQNLYDIFWWIYITNGIAFGPDYKINKDQIAIASILSTEAELFFFFHEFGHVIYDLNKKNMLDTKEFPDYILQIENEELFADLISVFILLGLSKDATINKSYNLDIIYSSIEFSILIFEALDKLGILENDYEHPLPSIRINNIREFIKKYFIDYKKIINFSNITSEVFDNVLY